MSRDGLFPCNTTMSCSDKTPINSVLLVPSLVMHKCVILFFIIAICASATVIFCLKVLTGEDIIAVTLSSMETRPVAIFERKSLSVIMPIGFLFSTIKMEPTRFSLIILAASLMVAVFKAVTGFLLYSAL